jgi:hypothetical protein
MAGPKCTPDGYSLKITLAISLQNKVLVPASMHQERIQQTAPELLEATLARIIAIPVDPSSFEVIWIRRTTYSTPCDALFAVLCSNKLSSQ